MDIEDYKKYGPIVVRLGMSFVFLWFGLNQIFNSEAWMIWLPQWAFNLPIEPTTFVLINGTFEVIFGGLLLLGLYTRVVALFLTIHLFVIAFNIGYNDVGIRDFGLALATFSIFLNGMDDWCLDKKRNRSN